MFKIQLKPFKATASRAILLSALLCGAQNASAQLAQDALSEGTSALANALYSDAEHCFVQYLSANQKNPAYCVEALSWLCMAVYKQGKYPDVLRLLDENADIIALDKAGIFDYWRARTLLEIGKNEESAEIIDNALARTNDSGIDTLRLYRLKGLVNARSDKPESLENARAAFSNANTRAASDNVYQTKMFRLDNLLDWAEAELKFGNKAEAEKILSEQRKLSNSVTNSISAEKGAIQLAKLLIESKHEKEADTILTGVTGNSLAHHANRAEAIIAIAKICSDTNRLDNLYSDLLTLELSPALLAEAKMRFGSELTFKENKEIKLRGVRILSSAVKCNTTSRFAPDCQLLLANTWMQLGSNSMAAAEFKNYTEAFSGEKSKDYIAKKGCATALFALGEYEESALSFSEAAPLAEAMPESAICLSLAADALYNASKYFRSAETYKQAAAMALAAGDRNLALTCRLKSADSVENTGNNQAALDEFNDIASDPEAGDFARKASYRKAIIYEQQNDNQSAELSYNNVLGNSTNDEYTVLARLGRGRTRYRMFNFKAAINDLKNFPEAYTNEADEAAYLLILSSYGLGQDESAATLASEFLAKRQSAKNLPDVMLWTAQYNFNRKNYPEAEKIFMDFVDKFPNNQMSIYALLWAANAAFKQSEFDKTNEILARISKLTSDQQIIPEARLLQAKALRELTRYEDSLSVLEEIITDYPADDLVVNALMLKGESLFALAAREPEGKGYLTAEQAFSNALLRSDIKPDQIIECSFQSARCFEKAGEFEKAVHIYCTKTIDKYAYFTLSNIKLSKRSAEFFSKAVFNAAALLEKAGNIDGAIKIFRHLETTSLDEREKASAEIRRLKTM